MDEKNKNKSSIAESENYRQVYAYLLGTGESPLSSVKSVVITAKRFDLKLNITGEKGSVYNRIITLLKKNKLQFTEIEYSPKIRNKPDEWYCDTDNTSLHIWVPESKHRIADIGLLVSFYINYHLTKLRENVTDFPKPKIDILYLLLLMEIFADTNEKSLSNRLFRDLLNSENNSVISVSNNIDTYYNEMHAVNGIAKNLSEYTLLYLGFTSDYDLMKELIANSHLKDHPLNKNFKSFILPDVKYVWYLKSSEWDVDSLRLILQNSVYLNSIKNQQIPEKQKECLVLRLKGLPEDKIADQLGFETFDEYQTWLNKNHLSITPLQKENQYQLWLEACDYFEIEPDLVDVGIEDSCAIENPIQYDTEGSSPNFRIGLGFSSFFIEGKGSFSLTPRQSDVLRILYEGYLDKTYDIHQSIIIQEVYGEVSETSLKKLFGYNTVWDLLIEPGKRKGQFRLKDLF